MMTPEQTNAVMMGIQTMHRKALSGMGPHVLVTRQLPDGKFDSLFFSKPENPKPAETVLSSWRAAWESTASQLKLAMTQTGAEIPDETTESFRRLVYMTLAMSLMSACQTANRQSLLEQSLRDPNVTPSISLDFTELLIETAREFFPQGEPVAVSVTQLDDQIFLDIFEATISPERLGQDAINRATQAYALGRTAQSDKIVQAVYVEKPDTQQVILFYLTAEMRSAAIDMCRPMITPYMKSGIELSYQQAADALGKLAEPVFEAKLAEREEGRWQIIAAPQTATCIPFLLQEHFYPDEPPANLALIRPDAFLLTVLEEPVDVDPVTPAE